jgi:hypothetical protein
MTDELRNFLELNLPKVKEGKKAKFSLGVAEPKIGSHIFEVTKLPCQSNDFVHELLRGVRLHFERFIKDLKVCISSDSCFSFLKAFLLFAFMSMFLTILFFSSLIPIYSLVTWRKPNLVWGTVTAEQK